MLDEEKSSARRRTNAIDCVAFFFKKQRRIKMYQVEDAVLCGMPEEKTKWIANDAVRKEKFKGVLQGGKREEIIALIKSVYLHKQKLLEEGKKKLHVADENVMKDAKRLLYDEFAYVLKLERNEVLPFILEQIDVK